MFAIWRHTCAEEAHAGAQTQSMAIAREIIARLACSTEYHKYPKINQKMSQSPNIGSVTPTSRLKDSRAMKLGVPPRTLWSNDQDPVLLVLLGTTKSKNALEGEHSPPSIVYLVPLA